MADETAFWAAIDALDDGLAPPPGFLPEKDVFAQRLSVDGGSPLAAAPAAQPFELSAAVVAFISACLFAGAMSAAFVFHSPLERLIVRPQPRAFIAGRARRIVWNAAERFTARLSFHASTPKSSIGPVCRTTALLTRMSMEPAVRIIASISSGLRRSAPTYFPSAKPF